MVNILEDRGAAPEPDDCTPTARPDPLDDAIPVICAHIVFPRAFPRVPLVRVELVDARLSDLGASMQVTVGLNGARVDLSRPGKGWTADGAQPQKKKKRKEREKTIG